MRRMTDEECVCDGRDRAGRACVRRSGPLVWVRRGAWMRTRTIALLGFSFILAGCKSCCLGGECSDVPDATQHEKLRDIHVQWLLAQNNDLVLPEFPRFDVLSEVDFSAPELQDRSGLLHYELKRAEVLFAYVPYDNPDDDCKYTAGMTPTDLRLAERLADAGVRAGLWIGRDSGGYFADEFAEVTVTTRIECPAANPGDPPHVEIQVFDGLSQAYVGIPPKDIRSYRDLEKGPLSDFVEGEQAAITWTITLQ
jgi:hypothetical protein